jgi:hypothetical protein
MKKLFPILLAMALFASACQAGGAQAEPTALSLPTAFPPSMRPLKPLAATKRGLNAFHL